MKEKDKDKLKTAKSYGSNFLDCVCDDCRAKVEPFFKKNMTKILLRPKKYQKQMWNMFCNKCKRKLAKRKNKVR